MNVSPLPANIPTTYLILHGPHARSIVLEGWDEGDGRDISKWVNGSVARKASLISGVEPCAMAFREPSSTYYTINFSRCKKNRRVGVFFEINLERIIRE